MHRLLAAMQRHCWTLSSHAGLAAAVAAAVAAGRACRARLRTGQPPLTPALSCTEAHRQQRSWSSSAASVRTYATGGQPLVLVWLQRVQTMLVAGALL
jgi:hypothetical protein